MVEDPNEQIRIAYRVLGKVQNVNYRIFAQWAACKYNIVGWVRNQDNGRLVLKIVRGQERNRIGGEAQGRREDLEAFIEILHHGAPNSRVDKVEWTRLWLRRATDNNKEKQVETQFKQLDKYREDFLEPTSNWPLVKKKFWDEYDSNVDKGKWFKEPLMSGGKTAENPLYGLALKDRAKSGVKKL